MKIHNDAEGDNRSLHRRRPPIQDVPFERFTHRCALHGYEEQSHRRAAPSPSSSYQIAAARLAGEARRVLAATIPGDCADSLLRDLHVESVEAPVAGALVVHLTCPGAADAVTIHSRLERLSGFLRAEIAHRVQRKRSPHLRFVLHPREVEP